MTEQLNQQQVNEVLRKWPLRTENRPTTEDFEAFKPIKEQWERLNTIPEAQRTVWQREAHAILLAELITTYDNPWFQWDRSRLSPGALNAAAAHHLKQYQK